MVIDKHTRVSEVIKANTDSIAALAALAKPLRKLKNPLLRKVMAPRVTLAEAAAMGGCSLVDIRVALEPLGFTFDQDGGLPPDPDTLGEKQKPDWLASVDDSKKDRFDVRDIIGSGGDPLKAITQRYRELPSGNLLNIINSFIPYPLISLLEKKGAKSYVETVADNEHHTWFFKQEQSVEALDRSPSDRVVMHDKPSFEGILAAYAEAQLVRIDVRPLPMPQPMETILETLPTLAPNGALYVQHKRVPLHLLEELADQAYISHIHEISEGDVKMLIARM